MSVLMIAAGVVAIGLPLMTGVAIGAIIAWLLLFSGALHVTFAWRGQGATGVLWEILVGVLYSAIAIFLLRHPVVELASLTLAIALIGHEFERREDGRSVQRIEMRDQFFAVDDAVVSVAL